ncbi:pyruvate kinase, partial [Candidatus Dojkabacteria bacterium]|nr:pyruvate kinase [Candidatus Dojkabacteria bacterium]
MKKTKIICTIGPATWNKETLAQLYEAGMNGARLNASFADSKDIREFIKMVRSVSPSIATILDTKGHKIRLNQFRKPIVLKEDEEFVIHAKPKKGTIYVTYKDLAKDLKVGSTILIDDGRIELEVKDIDSDRIITRVEQGGELKKGKSVNVPGTHLNFPPLTDKDYEDISLAIELKFDYIAASFIRNIEDVKVIKKLLNGSRTKLIAKIEDPEGVANFDSILSEVDGIMVARGDLGVEIPAEKVPILQKQFIKKCRLYGKPVIVATHMLESMVTNSHPTRAEVNDVANSIYDGADALMLSAETSTGRFPIKATKNMSRIAREVENYVP